MMINFQFNMVSKLKILKLQAQNSKVPLKRKKKCENSKGTQKKHTCEMKYQK